MIPTEVQEAITRRLNVEILSFTALPGGCINQAGLLVTTRSDLFLKWNFADRFPKMLEAEERGLALLRATGTMRLPAVVLSGTANRWQYLAMEFIEGVGRAGSWRDLGRELACLHKITKDFHGLDHDNYIGSLPQVNSMCDRWLDFFTQNRLAFQLRLLRDAQRIDHTLTKLFEALYPRLGELMPDEKPSLLHGDLWSGNVLAGPEGRLYVIDPAVYYGHREAEIAFTKLFGGFDQSFYEAYQEHFPLAAGFGERYELYNLYPLLVHANLFGNSYLAQVKRIIKHFS